VIVDLADALRCIRPHEPAALITSVDRLAGRQIVTGSLGCPVCDARYPVVEGAAVFDMAWLDRSRAAPPAPAAGEAAVIRVGALLDLTDPAGWVLLEGGISGAGAALHALLDTAVVLLNPPGAVPVGGDVSVIYAPVVPFRPDSFGRRRSARAWIRGSRIRWCPRFALAAESWDRFRYPFLQASRSWRGMRWAGWGRAAPPSLPACRCRCRAGGAITRRRAHR